MTEKDSNFNKSVENPETEKSDQQFKQDIDLAIDFVTVMNAVILFNDFESYEKLKEHSIKVNKVLMDKIGFDINKADRFLAKKYSINGTPGTSGEGIIKVSVFKTNDPQVFIGRYVYADGSIIWCLRPAEVVE